MSNFLRGPATALDHSTFEHSSFIRHSDLEIRHSHPRLLLRAAPPTRGATKKPGPFDRARLFMRVPIFAGRSRGRPVDRFEKLATERAAAQAAHASIRRGSRSGFFRRSGFFDHFATVATAIATAAAASAVAATIATAVATTMATTMATAVATTGEQTAVAAAVAATVTRAAAAAITGAASAVARATTAVTGDRFAGPAHEGQAHHRAKNRDAKNQCTIHPRILQKQQVPYRRGIGNASAVRDAFRSPVSGRPTQTGRVHLEPMPPPRSHRPSKAWPLRVKQDVTTAQARSLG